ncbi:MAG: nucleoside-diphosphate kinase [Candidatus Cloacimonetes bacterium]|nr:nucleoside-diphosphate kinase [Candidatus Cloacimonadota bacterium]
MTSPNNLTIEKTLCLIKPDAVSAGKIVEIITILKNDGFHIEKMKMMKMNNDIAQKFYYVHKNKNFFEGLIRFMTSNQIVAMILERENAIYRLRSLVGNTDSKIAAKGTIRNLYGTDERKNAIHASDSYESAKHEIKVIFDN